MSTVPITASTSVVLINVEDYAPNDPVVLFGKDAAYGKLVTVRDKAGTATAETPIYISTSVNAKFFQDVGGDVITIDQPFGSVTLLYKGEDEYTLGQWAIVNTFAYPEATNSALFRDVTTSTLLVEGIFRYEFDGETIVTLQSTSFDIAADITMNNYDISGINLVNTDDFIGITADIRELTVSSLYATDLIESDRISTIDLYADYSSTNTAEIDVAEIKDLLASTITASDYVETEYLSTTDLTADFISTIDAEINYLQVESTIAQYIDAESISTTYLYADEISTISAEIKDLITSTIFATDLIETEVISTVDLYADYSSTNTAEINELTVESTIAQYIDAESISTTYLYAGEISTISAEIKDLIASTIFATDLIETEYVSTTDLTADFISTLDAEIKDLTVSSITADFLDIDAISTTRLGADFISSGAVSTFSLKADRAVISTFLQSRSTIQAPVLYASSLLLVDTSNFFYPPIANQHRITVSSGIARLNNQDIYVIPSLISTTTLLASNIVLASNIRTPGISSFSLSTNFIGTREFIGSTIALTDSVTAPWISTTNISTANVYANNLSTSIANANSVIGSTIILTDSLTTPWISTTNISTANIAATRISTSMISTASLFGTIVRTTSNFTQNLAVNTATPLAGFVVDISGNAFIRTLFISSLFVSTQQVTGTELGRLGINCNAPRDTPYFYHLDVNGNAHVASNFYTSTVNTSTLYASSFIQTQNMSTLLTQTSSMAVGRSNARYNVDITGSLQASSTFISSINASFISTAAEQASSIVVGRSNARYNVDISGSLQASSTFISSVSAQQISTTTLVTNDMVANSLAFLSRVQASTITVSSLSALSSVTDTLIALSSIGTISTFTSTLHVGSNLNVGTSFFQANAMTNRIGLGNATTVVEVSGNYIRHTAQSSNVLATPNITLLQNNIGANTEIFEGGNTAATKNATLTVSRTNDSANKFYLEQVQASSGAKVGQGFLTGSAATVFGIQYGGNNSITSGLYLNSAGGVGVNTRGSIASGAALTVNGQTLMSNTANPLRIIGPTSGNQSTMIDFYRQNASQQSAVLGHIDPVSSRFTITTIENGADMTMRTINNVGVYVQDSTSRTGVGTTAPQFGLHVIGSMFASTISTTNLFTSSIRMVADTSGIYQGMYLSSGRIMLDSKAIAFTTDTQSNAGGIASIPLSLSTNSLFVSTISSQQVFTSTLNASGLTTLINQPIQSRWVGVGIGGSNVEWSDDGINWEFPTNNILTGNPQTVIYDGSKFIAGGSNIATSADGKTWTAISSPPTFTTCQVLATNGSTYLAGCFGTNKILTSEDGFTWSAVTQANTIFGTGCLGLGTTGRIWVAVGQGTNTIAYSINNGATWVAVSGSTSIFSSLGRCVAYNGTIWVAGGQGTNTLAYSYDGFTWFATPESTSIFSTITHAITWNGVMWVAAGQGTNTLAYSYDGITWIGIGASIFTTAGQSIAWNGSLWLAGGSGTNTHAYSFNGITWTGNGNGKLATVAFSFAYSSNLAPDLRMNNFGIYSQGVPNYTASTNQLLITSTTAVLNNSLFVNNATNNVGVNILPSTSIALDVIGKLRTSDQAILSSIATNSISSFLTNTSNLTTIIENSRVINTSSIFASTILASSITTSTIQTSTIQTNNATMSSLTTSSIVGTQFVASYISANNIFASSIASFSTNTTSLTASYLSSIGMVTSSIGIGTNTPQFLLDVNGSSRIGSLSTSIISTQAIQTSSISTSFLYASTIATSNLSTSFLQASNISSSQIFVSSLQANYISTPFAQIGGLSTSIISTQAIQASSISTSFLYGSTLIASNVSTTLFRASNASTVQVFTSSLNANFISSQFAQISTLSTIMIYTSTIATMLLSTVRFEAGELAFNTGSFTNLSVSGSGSVQNTWSSNILVAGGTGPSNTLAYSVNDGSNWIGVGNTIVTSVNAVIWNGTQFIAAGESSGTKVMTSPNGSNWTNITSFIMTTIYDVAYNGRQYVMVGTGGGTVQTNTSDPSGSSWTGWSAVAALSVGYGVAWNGSLWVAVGEKNSGASSIIYSVNGTTWLNATDGFSTRGRKVAWNGIYWIAVGEGTNKVVRSTDGITWTNVTPSGFTAGYDVAWNGMLWVIVGTGNTIMYSYDGSNWASVSSSPFSTEGYGVTWTGDQFVATGSGTNAFATSPNGVTWTARGTLAGFTAGRSIGYSQITTSDLILPNLNIYSRNTPNFLLSTNQILVLESSITINHTLTVNKDSDFVGIRNGNPTIELDVVGGGRMTSLSTTTISTNTITAGQIGVGIQGGSITSGYQAQIFGDTYITKGGNITDAGGALAFGINAACNASPMSQIKGVLQNAPDVIELQGGIAFSTRPSGSSGQTMTERLRIVANGQVGIGTTNPGYNLDVNGTIMARESIYVGGSADKDGAQIFMSGGTGDGDYANTVIESRVYQAGTQKTELLLFKGNDQDTLNGPDRIRLRAGQICFDTYSNPTNTRTTENIRMVVNSNGSVGIGTTAPLANTVLDILGGSRNSGLDGSNLLAFQYFEGGGFRHFIKSRHDGTAGNGNGIDFYLNNSNTAAGSSAAGTGNVLRMSIAGNGVGIGTTNPTSALDVNGAITIAGGTGSSAYGSPSPTQTYMTLGPNGSASDHINIRQIGGSNQITLAYDFHDDLGDCRFVLRNAPSAAGINPFEIMRVDNDTAGTGTGGTLQITQFSNATNTDTAALRLYNRSDSNIMSFYTNLNAGGFNSLTQAGDKGIIFTNGAVDTGNLVIAPHASGGAKGIRMTAAGNVGIGTTNPGTALQVNGTTVTSVSVTASTKFNVLSSDPTNGPTLIWSSGDSYRFATASDTGGTSYTERMRITSGGSVGIGTTNPTRTLDVNGTARIGVATPITMNTDGGNANIEIGTGRTVDGDSYLDLTSVTTADYNLRIQRGSGANGLSLITHRGTGDFLLNTEAAAPIMFQTNSTERMRITSGGSVGIGTTNPEYNLAVNGTMGLGGYQMFGIRAWVNFSATGGVITIKGNGNVSSVTRNNTGDFTINFATALQDTNYGLAGMMPADSMSNGTNTIVLASDSSTSGSVKLKSTTAVRIFCFSSDSIVFIDSIDTGIVIYR